MKVLYFSATGNSLYVAKEFGGENYSIPKLIKDNDYYFEDEQIGIVFPTFYNGVPKLVEDFMRKVQLKSPYIFGIITFGVSSGATTRHVHKIASEVGIDFSYINEIAMVDNYLPVFDISKQMITVDNRKIEANLEKIVNDIKNKREYINKSNILTVPIKHISRIMFRNKSDRDFNIDSKCNGCNICVKVCPVDNISVDTRPAFHNNCIQCLSCIHNCPQTAIHIKGEKNNVRFINPNIKLQEIIDANQ